MTNLFLNYDNGFVTVNTFRTVGAQATDVDDIISALDRQTSETLCASLDIHIEEELAKIDTSKMDDDDIADFVFGEADFLSNWFDKLGLDLGDYPELCDYQHDFVSNAIEAKQEQ